MPSRRNRPTTPSSIVRATVRSAALGLGASLLLAAAPLDAAEPDPPRKAGRSAAASSPEPPASLEALKNRSPRQRWERLKAQWRKRITSPPPESEANAASPESAGSAPRPVPTDRDGGPRWRLTAQPDDGRAPGFAQPPADDFPYAEPVRDPRELKKITEIRPSRFYNPHPDGDPCRYVCPRPDHPWCQADPSGTVPNCPEELVLSTEQYKGRAFPDRVFAWEASNLHYNPLYFEDTDLERYGHTYPFLIQPFASVGQFGAQLVGLPYQMTIDPVHERIYPLGYYQPGDAAPYLHYQIPWNTKAALVEGGVLTGLFFAVP